MRIPAAIALALACTQVAAQDWFTVYGYPELPETDMIQISPALSSWQRQVTFEVRVTRKAERLGYSGVRYRSYSGLAAVDCESGKGWFLRLVFFGEPGWQGEPIKQATFNSEEAPMRFADIPGMQAAKVITAACAAAR